MPRPAETWMDIRAATAWLRWAAESSAGVFADLGPSPLVVVDLESPGDPAGLRVPILLPAVVVGISGAGSAKPEAAEAMDCALTGDARLSRPWSWHGDPMGALQKVVDQVTANPIAAMTFAQVLRASRNLEPESGLLVESLAYSTLQSGPEFARWRRTAAKPSLRPGTAADVLVVREGPSLRITLNRPAVHNAYNAKMRELLCDALVLATIDESVEHVSIVGAGPSFCSGGDLAEFGTFEDPASAHLIRTSRSPARLLQQLSGRTSAHLHGACMGSGVELPAFAASVTGAPDAVFGLPEISLGLIPGAGGTVSLVERIGRHRVAGLGLSGLTIDAPTAKSWGLIDSVRDNEDSIGVLTGREDPRSSACRSEPTTPR